MTRNLEKKLYTYMYTAVTGEKKRDEMYNAERMRVDIDAGVATAPRLRVTLEPVDTSPQGCACNRSIAHTYKSMRT